jgi:hypothetical protein
MSEAEAMKAMMKDKKKSASAVKKPIPKLFANDHNSRILKAFNGVYKLFYIVKMFSGKIMWYSSCGKQI